MDVSTSSEGHRTVSAAVEHRKLTIKIPDRFVFSYRSTINVLARLINEPNKLSEIKVSLSKHPDLPSKSLL